MKIEASTLVLPEKVQLRLVSEDARPVLLANVLFRIRAFARRKNDFDFGPFATDSKGVANISHWELMAEATASYDSGLMDYCSIDTCFSEVEIHAMTNEEIQRAIHSRTNVWLTLLTGEEKRWPTIEALVEAYRHASNSRIRTESIRVKWDGSRSEYEHSVIAHMI